MSEPEKLIPLGEAADLPMLEHERARGRGEALAGSESGRQAGEFAP